MIKKGLALAVILLFVSVAIAPSINASVVKDDLIEFDVEFCGLGKKHTVELTQQEALEVELLFADIEHRLSKIETREEAEIIFKEAVVELDKYGLLGGLSVRQAQRLVTGRYQNIGNFLMEKSILQYSNMFCLLAGSVDAFHIKPLLVFHMNLLDEILQNIGYGFLWIEYYLFMTWFLYSRLTYMPIHFFKTILFFAYEGEDWLFNVGLLGIRMWRGHFNGNIPIPIKWTSLYGDETVYPAIIGFRGISIQYHIYDLLPGLVFKPFMLGTAPLVSVELVDL